jgi:threonine--tRNA ligase
VETRVRSSLFFGDERFLFCILLGRKEKMLKMTMPDGAIRDYDKESVTPLEIAESISHGLAKKALGASVDGEIYDLLRPITKDAEISILTFDDEEGQKVFHHTSAHLLAQAVKNLWPETKIAIGPAIKDGFYHDFDSPHTFVPEDIEKIEQEMKRLVKENADYKRREISRVEAIELFEKKGETYKVELIKDMPEEEVITIYESGDYTDLCAGPHLPKAGMVKAFKVMSLAGAYWKGDEKNKMLQRIYGTSFPKEKELEAYLFRLEEAKRRDHRRLGKELDLYSFVDEAPGFPVFHPKGMVLRNQIETFWRQCHARGGYDEVRTPLIMDRKLWERSGHWEHYKENMYFTEIDEAPFAVKPMNCPGGILLYNESMHSYRDLPLRWAELGLVHRHELSGALHGLMRVRAFTQDDAHIFMLESQIKDELIGVIHLIDEIYKPFGFKYKVELSTKPEKAMGSDELWEKATSGLMQALEEVGMSYTLNPGDGAFYGPKIDYHLEDSLGRTWQCGTIQLDFQMPEKFDMTYIGEDGEKHRPVMVHRAILGSMERFIGILTEHFAGAFPIWLSPVQTIILPITDDQADYAREIAQKLKKAGVRAEVDYRNEKIGYKIREAQMQKIPYMLVVGKKEVESQTVSVRDRKEGDVGIKTIDEILAQIVEEIQNKVVK